MQIAFLTFAAIFAAAAVWLTVRFMNRRERWAKWTLGAIIIVPALYVLSFGPACHLADRGVFSPEQIRTAFRPLLFEAGSQQSLVRRAVFGFANLCGGEDTVDTIEFLELVDKINSVLDGATSREFPSILSIYELAPDSPNDSAESE